MSAGRKYVISIAGFDPSGGAGILADIKTFEQHHVHGLGVCSAITLQTEDEFRGVAWIPLHQIQLQLEVLMQKYSPQFLKVGLVQSIEVLEEIVRFIRNRYREMKIIWDPILKASAGFQFHHFVEENLLHEILSQIYLITPNASEAKAMTGESDPEAAGKILRRFCNVYLKSFNDDLNHHLDRLFEKGEEWSFISNIAEGFEKHGSGCVLSAAITANLAMGRDLKTSCQDAKEYTLEYLRSSKGLLGEHSKINITQHA